MSPERSPFTIARHVTALEQEVRALQRLQHATSPGAYLESLGMLPELRGLWAFSSINETPAVLDLSYQGRTLSAVVGAIPTRGVLADSLVPYTVCNGSTAIWYRADEAHLDITGPLSCAGWYYFNALGSFEWPFAKWAGGGLSWGMRKNDNDSIQTMIYNGTAQTIAITGAGAITAGRWHFLLERFTGTQVGLYLNGAWTYSPTVAATTIFNSTTPFIIGAFGTVPGYSQVLNGRAALVFLSAAALSDGLVDRLYQTSRPFFGV